MEKRSKPEHENLFINLFIYLFSENTILETNKICYFLI